MTEDSGSVPLRLHTDSFGDFDALVLGDDEVLVSDLNEDEVVDVHAELTTRGFKIATEDLASFAVPVVDDTGWEEKARSNLDRWGVQSVETLLLAMQEEMGELTQAHLEARDEDGDSAAVRDELDDLAALCYQLAWTLDNCAESERRGTDQ